MARDWREMSLGDLVDIKHGFAFKGEFIHDEPSGDVLLTPGNFSVGGGFKRDKLKFYHGPVPDEFILREGDLLVTMTDLSKQSDTLGFPAFVPPCLNGRRYLHNQRLGRVSIREPTETDAKYISYVMCGASYRHEILASATGTTVKHTSPSRIKQFRFLCAPPSEQRDIASILGALDDKIDVNRRMNETVEAIVRALFRDWFVDFGPVRAKMEGRTAYLPLEIWHLFPDALDEAGRPAEWTLQSVYDFARVVYGAPFASKRFNTSNDGVPLIRIRDLGTHEPSVSTSQNHRKGHLIQPGDIVVGMDGEFRLHVWKGPRAWLNQRVCHFEPKLGVPKSFLAEALKEPLEVFERAKVGTTVIHLGKSDIDTFEIVQPGEELLGVYANIAEPLLDRAVANALESRTLVRIRNLLLPKLISGEIRLREAEKVVEAVA